MNEALVNEALAISCAIAGFLFAVVMVCEGCFSDDD